jgi:cation transport regulator ChaB
MPDASTDGDVPDEIRDLAHTMQQIYKTKYLATIDDEQEARDEQIWIENTTDPLDAAIENASAAATRRL